MNWLDFISLSIIQSFSSPAMDVAMISITELGNVVFWFFLAALLYWKGKEHHSFHLINIILMTAAFVGFTKSFFMRARPSSELFRILTPTYDFSFPSGHAAMVTAGSFFVYKFLKTNWKFLLIPLIIIVGISRIYLGAHFLTDVFAGILVGLIIGYLGWLFHIKFRKNSFVVTKLEDDFFLVAFLAILILIAVFESYPLALITIFVGYYFGFFYIKERGFEDLPVVSNKVFLKRALFGSIGLFLILLVGLFANSFFVQAFVFFFVGAWISGFFPLIYINLEKENIILQKQKLDSHFNSVRKWPNGNRLK